MSAVTFSPGMRSGEPTINGSRIPVDLIGQLVWHGDGAKDVADDYNLTREDILVACWFLGTYGVAGRTERSVVGKVWRKRWETWARVNHGHMWRGDFDAVPDPPSQDEADE